MSDDLKPVLDIKFVKNSLKEVKKQINQLAKAEVETVMLLMENNFRQERPQYELDTVEGLQGFAKLVTDVSGSFIVLSECHSRLRQLEKMDEK